MYLTAFSAYENGTKLFQRKENESSSRTMANLNGVRVFSIVWVVLAHSYMVGAIGPLTNAVDMLNVGLFGFEFETAFEDYCGCFVFFFFSVGG